VTVDLPVGTCLVEHEVFAAATQTVASPCHLAAAAPSIAIAGDVQGNVEELRRRPIEEVLAMFTMVCGAVLADKTAFSQRVRHIKDLFIQRDFLAIFTDPSNLLVYLARWVPPRALCYLSLFGQSPTLKQVLTQSVRWTCLGAGPGSELVALSALATLEQHAGGEVDVAGTITDQPRRFLDVFLHDIGDFGPAVSRLVEMTQQRWGISEDRFRAQFVQGDLLAQQMAPELEVALSSSHVVTMMFVVNELFQQDLDATLKTLRDIAKRMHRHAFLVIADSVSDMSTITVFGGKQYRVPTVLDNLFKSLTKVSSADSAWHRLPKVSYQCELQNVHYFLRIYQKP